MIWRKRRLLKYRVTKINIKKRERRGKMDERGKPYEGLVPAGQAPEGQASEGTPPAGPKVSGERRIALVIGNGHYKQEGDRLANPPRDVKIIASAFEDLGFDLVQQHNDLELRTLGRALTDFRIEAQSAHTAVIYYAGHGIEIDGLNRLIPVDAELDHVIRVPDETIPLNRVQQAVQEATNLRVVILDACRNNPFFERMRGLSQNRDAGAWSRIPLEQEPTRSIGQGLAAPKNISGMLVAYAADAGKQATDGPADGNSPFARALAEILKTEPELDIRILFGKVRDKVVSQTKGVQEPAIYGQLGGGTYAFAPGKTDISPHSVATGGSTPPEAHSLLALAAQEWERLKDTKNIAALKDFAQDPDFCNTYYARQALELIGRLDAEAARLKAERVSKEAAQRNLEDANWTHAKQEDSIDAYKNFINTWSNGSFAEEATNRIAKLEADRVRKEAAQRNLEDANWTHAKQKKTIEAYRNYVYCWSNGRYVEEARTQIAQLKKEKENVRHKIKESKRRQDQARKKIEGYRSGDPIHIEAPIIHGATEGWFKPGNGRAEWFKDIKSSPKMVVVPAGKFTMGSPKDEPKRDNSEGPQHEVTIAKPFAVCSNAISFNEWHAYVGDGKTKGLLFKSPERYVPENHGWGRGRRPVINVSWKDTLAYISWLSDKTGQHYRLLSEAEWEYVARAGRATPFWWGKSITPNHANYDGNFTYVGGGAKGKYRRKTVSVDSFDANPWGLYSVNGNVLEWCEDIWHNNYNGAPTDGCAWLQGGEPDHRVVRGGSWVDYPRNLRSASRKRLSSDLRGYDLGFRLARTLIL